MIIKAANRMLSSDGHFLAKQQEQIRKLEESGETVINLGRGNPDKSTFPKIVEAFNHFSQDTANFGYPPYGGKESLKKSIISFYKQEYNVDLTIEEVTIFSGSLAALTALPMVLANENDNVLIPNPSFFGYTTGVKMAGANPIYMDLKEENNFLPDYQQISSQDIENTKMMFLNYPNNPTGAGATESFFEETVRFAIKNEIVVVHDFAYADISFNRKAPSFLQAKGAKQVGIEIYTLSKTFNMAGWRIAFAVGNKEVISFLNHYIRSSVGGTFGAIQDAVTFGLNHATDERKSLRRLYDNRRQEVVSMLKNASINYFSPAGTFFVWVKLPKDWDDVAFTNECLEIKRVAVVAGSVFGTMGKGYIRLSLVAAEEELREGVKQLISFINRRYYARSKTY